MKPQKWPKMTFDKKMPSHKEPELAKNVSKVAQRPQVK